MLSTGLSARASGVWSELGAEIAAFALAGTCSGCDAPGTLLCEECADALTARSRRRSTPGGLEVVTALEFDGVPARCIRRLKEEGETMLARPLGTAASVAIRSALPDHDRCALVPVPTSRAAFRRRGYRVPELLIRRAGFPLRRLLLPARATADQRGLGRTERERNVRGSMRARRTGDGTPVLILDDVITTGATLDEAARVLGRAGFPVLGAVALAATPRHGGYTGDTSVETGDIR